VYNSNLIFKQVKFSLDDDVEYLKVTTSRLLHVIASLFRENTTTAVTRDVEQRDSEMGIERERERER